MKVDRLLGLFQGQQSNNKSVSNASTESNARASSANSEAVRLAPGLSEESGDRANKIAELKAAVQSGSYKQPDSVTLARAVARDLF
jgi:anti-sigma28 factor (negative regulator of flagellin synthesis)